MTAEMMDQAQKMDFNSTTTFSDLTFNHCNAFINFLKLNLGTYQLNSVIQINVTNYDLPDTIHEIHFP